MAVKVAINGFGRIGRNVLRAIVESGRTDIEVVAINDLGPVETNAHLLRFDSVHGRFPHEVKVEGDSIVIGSNKIKVTAERDPSRRESQQMADIMGSGGLAWHQWQKHGRCSGLSAAASRRWRSA